MPEPLAPYLTDEIRVRARACARGRLDAARRRNRSQPFGDPGDEKRVYVDAWSSLAEALVAAWLDLPWNDTLVEDLTEKPPDVGRKIEVRWTPHPDGHLIAHPTDPDDWILVLVRGELPDMEAAGWTVGVATREYEGRNPRSRNPTDRWVPASALMMTDLLWQMRKGPTI